MPASSGELEEGLRRGPADKLLSLPTERLIALARFLFAGFALLAIWLDPSQPARYVAAAYALLAFYLVYAAVIAAISQSRLMAGPTLVAVHAADIAVFSVLIYFTDGLSSPFFVFFTFALLAATLRWNWKGAAATTVVLVSLFLLSTYFTLPSNPDYELNRLIIRSAYLVTAGAMLTYFGAFRDSTRQRLARLAAWPAEQPRTAEQPELESSLAHACKVLNAERALVVWQEENEPACWTAYWNGKECETVRGLSTQACQMVPPSLEAETFLATGARKSWVQLRSGQHQTVTSPVSGELAKLFSIEAFATSPFAGRRYQGRVFMIAPRQFTDDLLSLTEIVASRIGVELEQHGLRTELAAKARDHERVRLARDMHDGILQDLTAAALKLKRVAEGAPTEIGANLGEVSNLLYHQHDRIHRFVRATDPKPPANGWHIGGFLDELSRQWDCAISLESTPTQLQLSSEVGLQLSLLLAEATANAVRHGKASAVCIGIEQASDSISVRIRDNGTGMELSKTPGPGAGPSSICKRVAQLGGRVAVSSSGTGTELALTVPLK